MSKTTTKRSAFALLRHQTFIGSIIHVAQGRARERTSGGGLRAHPGLQNPAGKTGADKEKQPRFWR